MISKERLEELIEQGATIYELYMNKNILEIQLKTDWFVVQYGLYERKLSKHPFRSWQIGNLYETKEDAEFVREFGCIERTERLELPTWEEVNKPHNVIVHFINKDGLMCNLVVENHENKITVNGVGGCYDIWELTKENYILACRQCVKLFKG